jgi:hypothetical protein
MRSHQPTLKQLYQVNRNVRLGVNMMQQNLFQHLSEEEDEDEEDEYQE